MNKMLSVAIIGTGQIAGGYDLAKIADSDPGVFTHAGAYSKSGRYILESVFDVDPKKAADFQLAWGFSKRYSEFDSIANNFHDVISVCTPDETHYQILKNLIDKKCCKSIFVEKPIASTLEQIHEISELAEANDIAVVINFQRHFDEVLANFRSEFIEGGVTPLAANAYYIKGLDHIGTTMIDTITYLLGYPKTVLGFNKVFNQSINDDTYEFILFYDDYNVTVKTIDSALGGYNYHIFELDLLFSDKRVCINDNSRQIELRKLADYAYSGVRVLDDHHVEKMRTQYDISMLNSVTYIHDVVAGRCNHTVNTPKAAYNVKLIIENIKKSYEFKKTIDIQVNEWKK